ncbi:MAG: GspE/PulE family protein [Gammaproteobacteria bacterium]|nr:GspE/PulE family protein [Gammaproteobacteria bacterium]
MAGHRKIRIGDLLVSKGEITEEQLQQALVEQKKQGLKLGRILINMGCIEEDRFLEFLSEQLKAPFYDLKEFSFDPDVVARLPETYARRYRALLLEERDGELVVGMADPMDIFAYDEISRQLGAPINVAVVRESELMAMLDMAYRRTSDIVSFASELEGELTTEQFSLGYDPDDDDASSPVVRLLQSIMEDAVQIRASDVHIEPDEHVLRIRQRVDGVLQEQTVKEARIASALVSRLKLMAGLDISEKRLPQDGRFEVHVKNKEIDVRLSTMPVQFGESAVMRLADHSGAAGNLESVGMSAEMLARFRFLVNRPNGLVLVTGPTGSGKTTTLYGALNELNSPEKKIITVEDPVEYQLPRINQVQVMAKIGLTFATVLRATLRQDPDIVLLGEIRDLETAEIALRASMTGHLVLSTLHTNDAISSATRLLDIGVEGYLVAASLRGVVAQRLVRRVCDRCAEPDQPDDQQHAWLSAVVGEAQAHELAFSRGRGCNQCNQTGYFGRIGVFELLEFNEDLANCLRAGDAGAFARQARAQPGFRPLVLNALDYAVNGDTTLSEVLALSGQVEELLPAGPRSAGIRVVAGPEL